mmetsp:Transcript_16126/g.29209  ORF Transcript_16126/g.29209 Transcript_16126/m.29209 type:complete len:202 (+) Transcript_16126:61-666(+)
MLSKKGRVDNQNLKMSFLWPSVGTLMVTTFSNLPTRASCNGNWAHDAREIPSTKYLLGRASVLIAIAPSISLTMALSARSCSDDESASSSFPMIASRSSIIKSLRPEHLAPLFLSSKNLLWSKEDVASSRRMSLAEMVETVTACSEDATSCDNTCSNHDAILVLPTPAHPDSTTAVGAPFGSSIVASGISSSRTDSYPGQE